MRQRGVLFSTDCCPRATAEDEEEIIHIGTSCTIMQKRFLSDELLACKKYEVNLSTGGAAETTELLGRLFQQVRLLEDFALLNSSLQGLRKFGLNVSPKGLMTVLILTDLFEFNLSDFLLEQQKQLTLQMKVNILLQIAEGLQHLRSRNLVHTQVAPQHVLLNESLEVVSLIDFSCAVELRDPARAQPLPHKPEFKNPFYAPPELLVFEQAHALSDVYSFGCLMLELLTLKRPYFMIQPPKLLNHLQFGEESVIDHYRKHSRQKISPQFLTLLESCTAREPHKRCSISEAIKELKKFT